MGQRGAYRSVFSALFDDPDYQWLSKDCRLLLLTLRLCKQAGPSAIFRYYTGQLSAQTGLTVKQIGVALEQLREQRWIDFDATVVWVRNGLRYEPHVTLADSKHRKSIERYLSELPKSPVVLKFCDYYEMARAFEAPSKPLRSPFEAVEPDPDPDPDPDSLLPPRAEEATWPSPEALVELYNVKAPDECPAVTVLSPQRRVKAKAYLAQFPQQKFWEEVCDQIRVSNFLRGLVRSGNGHKPFVADFDWLLTKGKDGSENCVKVYEGKYRG